MKVILASASPRRKELITRLFEEYTVVPADIDETIPDEIGAEFAPVFLAAQKAQAISETNPNALIIAADTVVIADGEILGKPKDRSEAKQMLRFLSGKTHKVITGCCISKGTESCSFYEESYVTFYELSEKEIDEYVDQGLADGKAGAYGIQDNGALFVQKIEGDYYNIVGLPIARLNREIQQFLEEEK